MIRTPTLLSVDNVHFSYESSPVLEGLCLEVAQGEMLALVGPNGAGKTTLLRAISGALKPQRGAVYLKGINMREAHAKERARLVSMVSQSPALPRGFTSLEVVLMGRNPHLGLLQWEGPKDVEAAMDAMERTGTADLANRPLAALSGGERQRVFIARALAQEASLLLLDEPTAHLDIGFQSGILDTIEGIRTNGAITVIAAMHDLTLAAQYCDRMAVLGQGVIVALGAPGDVLTPELVSVAFGAEVSIVRHPVNGAPVALPVRRSHGGGSNHGA
jgi:iron complex transport system ATP-binding protein